MTPSSRDTDTACSPRTWKIWSSKSVCNFSNSSLHSLFSCKRAAWCSASVYLSPTFSSSSLGLGGGQMAWSRPGVRSSLSAGEVTSKLDSAGPFCSLLLGDLEVLSQMDFSSSFSLLLFSLTASKSTGSSVSFLAGLELFKVSNAVSEPFLLSAGGVMGICSGPLSVTTSSLLSGSLSGSGLSSALVPTRLSSWLICPKK